VNKLLARGLREQFGMRALHLVASVGACALCACHFSNFGSSAADDDSVSDRPELSCAPHDPDWAEVQALYDTTEESVHELITCGGLQVRIAGSIVMMLVASNQDLFKQEERALIEEVTLNPFVQAKDGRWTMPIDSAPDSTFELSFYDPDTDALITEDVFDLDSYLAGVHIQTEVGLKEMTKDPTKKHAFVFTWDSEGPLAHLLNGGKPLPDGFELQLSLSDFLNGNSNDFGPFASVLALEMDSVVDYIDERGDAADTKVEYRVSATRDSVDHVATSQSLAFDVDHLTGRAGRLTLDGNTDNLTFVQYHELAGRIDYRASGKIDETTVDIRVRSDFGAGNAYPTTKWSCR
jgi:hypothetical protein